MQRKREVLTVLLFYLSATLGACSGVSFVDATRLRGCDNKRISSHRVFKDGTGLPNEATTRFQLCLCVTCEEQQRGAVGEDLFQLM